MTDNTKTTAAHLVLNAGGVRSLSYAVAISALAEQGITFAFMADLPQAHSRQPL